MKLRQTTYQTALLIGVSASLFGCSTPEIQKMSAIDAVKFGNTQFFDMPNYRFDMSAKLLDFKVIDDTDSRKTESFNKYANYFGKHITFNSSAVIDTANQQFQFIPSYGYESKNANGSVRFPIVYDHKQKMLFADMSALSGMISAPENEGKYSSFSTANLPFPEGTDAKLMKLMRKYSSIYYDDLKPEAFVELPLTASDRSQKAVRKIQVTMKPQEALAQFPTMMQDLAQVFSKEGDEPIAPMPDSAIAEMKDKMSKMLGENSKEVYSIGFNRAGQIVSMNNDSVYEMDMSNAGDSEDTSAPKMNMHFNINMTVSDIGTAKLIDPPTAANTVDGKENFKGGLLGDLFGNKHDDDTENAPTIYNDDEYAVDAAKAAGTAVDAAKAASQPARKKPRKKARRK